MSYMVQLSDNLEAAFRKVIEVDAPSIWGHGIDFNKIHILAGNVASYGKHVAQCDSHYSEGFSFITFPTDNSFSVVDVRNDRRLHEKTSVHDASGVLLHELGHHAVAALLSAGGPLPWDGVKAGHSIHTNPAWCWICSTAWSYFNPEWRGSMEALAKQIREDNGLPGHKRSGLINVMRSFGRGKPPKLKYPKHTGDAVCQHCDTTFKPERSTARYCSVSCKGAAYRARRTQNANIL